MAAGAPNLPNTTSDRRKAWSAIRQKLDRLLHSGENRELDPIRVEVAGIIETLDAINRDAEGLRGRGLRGDLHRS